MEKAVKLPVDIHFSSEIQDRDEKVHFSFQTNGLYYIKEGKYYLLFNEKLEEPQQVKTTIKWSDNEAWIKRSGTVNMRIPFQLHKKTRGIHETPEVKLEMTAYTDQLVHTWNEQDRKGLFRLTYILSMQGEEIGSYQLEVQFKEE
jgi:uncharacterized beta-barrel protein YwiB (DUF1934 family)